MRGQRPEATRWCLPGQTVLTVPLQWGIAGIKTRMKSNPFSGPEWNLAFGRHFRFGVRVRIPTASMGTCGLLADLQRTKTVVVLDRIPGEYAAQRQAQEKNRKQFKKGTHVVIRRSSRGLGCGCGRCERVTAWRLTANIQRLQLWCCSHVFFKLSQ